MTGSPVLTGIGLAVPGADRPEQLEDPAARAGAPVDPLARLGRTGLRYRDHATRLAYCAAQDALVSAGLAEPGAPAVAADPIATIVSSNRGNLDTLCRVSRTIDTESTTAVSPMELPNASSNVIAASVATKFGLRGPNLTVCNGHPSGLDAVRWAMHLIAAGRARQVLVVGVEPAGVEVRALLGASDLLDGAAAIVVEDAAAADERGRTPLAVLGRFRTGADLDSCVRGLAAEGPFGRWHLPGGTEPAADLLTGTPRRDLTHGFGDASGALGVLQCAAAAGYFGTGGTAPVLATSGGRAGGSATSLVLRPLGGPV